MQRAAFGQRHAETATAYFRLANILTAQSQLSDAEQTYRRGIASAEAGMHPFHPDLFRMRNDFGTFLLRKRTQATEALVLYRRTSEAVWLRTKNMGNDRRVLNDFIGMRPYFARHVETAWLAAHPADPAD